MEENSKVVHDVHNHVGFSLVMSYTTIIQHSHGPLASRDQVAVRMERHVPPTQQFNNFGVIGEKDSFHTPMDCCLEAMKRTPKLNTSNTTLANIG